MPFDHRRITYGVLLSTFGVVAFSFMRSTPPWVAVTAAWTGAAYLFVGVTYLAGRPQWFGKRLDGTQRWPIIALMGPYLGVVWVAWQTRRLARETAWDEISPGLFLGRRCVPAELPPTLSLVVDVTAELPSTSPSTVMPILDGCAPPLEQLAGLVEQISAAQGNVFVHCLAGHGRSAMVMAALLLARGIATTPDDAVKHVKGIRRGIRLAPGQRATLEAWHRSRQLRSSLGAM